MTISDTNQSRPGAACLCHQPGCTWLRDVSELGATAAVLMAPTVHAPDELEAVLVHPVKLRVPPDWLKAKTPSRPQAILLEQEQRNPSSSWASELLLQGYRSAVQTQFGLVGGKSCQLWVLSTGVMSDPTGAMIVWSAHCQWPGLRATMFRRRSSLTPREIDALRALANGCTQAEIAVSLGCADRTVRFHLENAMAKLGANNSNAAIQRALLLGLA